MAETKVAWMLLKVDLSCTDCYKNVKKILAKSPEIRDQVYDKNKNEVKIMAVCCCPEKIRDKLLESGGNVIKSIEIIEPKAPPVQKPPEVVVGVSVPDNYYPILKVCPKCSGKPLPKTVVGGCPWCNGYGKFVQQPPPESQFHNYYGRNS